MDNRIVYNAEELIQLLEGSLDKLQPFRYDSKYRQLLGESVLNKLAVWDGHIRRQKDSPLTLVVCGEFKRGKSSLINAILGEDVVTTDITTETITTNKICYGAHRNELILSGGKRMVISDEELKKEALSAILARVGESNPRLELKRPLEILKQVTIIDTPGLEDSSKDFSSQVQQALTQADAVVYVYSVAYPLSVREQLFIKTAIKPQKYTELFLVGNMADILEDGDASRRVQTMLNSRLEQVLPGETTLMLSALNERCRQLEARRPNEDLACWLDEQFDAFRARLTELLENKRDCVLPDRIQRMIVSMAADVRQDMNAIGLGLGMNQEEAARQMADIRRQEEQKVHEQTKLLEKLDSLVQLHYGQSVEWITQLLDNMEADTANLSKYSPEDIKKFYVLFCVETLQEALQRCLDHATMEVYDALDDVCADLSRKFTGKAAAAPVALSFSLRNKTWTKGDNVAFVSSTMGVSGTLLGVAVDYIAGSMRQKKIASSGSDLVAEIRQQYVQLRTNMMKALRESFQALKEEAARQIGVYFDETIQQAHAQAEQSAIAARQSQERKEEIRQALDELGQVIRELEEEFAF